MFSSLVNALIFVVLVGMIFPATVALCFFYPFSKKICEKLSDYVVNVLSHRLFSILICYKKFRTDFSNENRDILPEQFIVLSNHQSLLDIPVYMDFFRGRAIRFVAKDALSKNVPLVSPMLKSHGHCFIPRRGGASVAMRRLDAFSKRCLENRWNPIIFPEGSRSKDGSLGTFYSAGFRRIAAASALPIVVCALDEGYKMNDLFHIMENMDRVCYRAKILKVFPPALTKERQGAILDEAKVLISTQLAEWRKNAIQKH